MTLAAGCSKSVSMRALFQIFLIWEPKIFYKGRISEMVVLDDKMVINGGPYFAPRRAPDRDIALCDLVERMRLENRFDFKD